MASGGQSTQLLTAHLSLIERADTDVFTSVVVVDDNNSYEAKAAAALIAARSETIQSVEEQLDAIESVSSRVKSSRVRS